MKRIIAYVGLVAVAVVLSVAPEAVAQMEGSAEAPATQPTTAPADAAAEQAVRGFWTAMIEGDEQTLRSLSIERPGFEALLGGTGMPPPAKQAVLEQIRTGQLHHYAVGETAEYPTAQGVETLTITEEHVNEQQKMIAMPGQLPLPVVNVEGQWRVDPAPLIAARQPAEAAPEAEE